MSDLIQPEHSAARRSPSNINLGSNNPFRNHTTSPALASPTIPPPRPVSRNPFLDPAASSSTAIATMSSPEGSPFLEQGAPTSKKSPIMESAAELFNQLELSEDEEDRRPAEKSITSKGPAKIRSPPHRTTSDMAPPPYANKSENVRPPGHRPSRSQEEAQRARRAAARTSSKSRGDGLDIFADSGKGSSRSPRPRERRRNSESSVVSKSVDPDEEKRRQERRKDRERRHQERSDAKPKKGKLDIIDQLDATSIYGTGLFHHDGPFDACNPNRNRKGSRRAPMQAFPKDSLNNALGGGGPVHKQANHDALLMRNEEDAFNDFGKGGIANAGYEPYGNGRPGTLYRSESHVISATARVEPIHGDESLGLGTSTFLEGAPASRAAVVRIQAEAREGPSDGALGRKKSLAQKFRGIHPRRGDYTGPSARVTSPDAINVLGSPESPLYTPGGHKNETNPFFNEFSTGDDTAPLPPSSPEPMGRARAPSSPKRFGEAGGIERRLTGDGTNGGEHGRSGGFLNRVKSLKGGASRRAAPATPPKAVLEPTAL